MESEIRQCQNCSQAFTIEPDDFLFYLKIHVPPPTFCPDCRKQRRLAFRNTHSLYKRKDSFSGKDIISIYSSDKNLVIMDQKDWWSDSWDALQYGKSYDFSKSFFQQWKELRDSFPLQSLSNSKAINSEYCNVNEESKDCYLISASWKNERVMYSDAIDGIKDSMDLHVVHRAEFCYDDVTCSDSYKLFYSQDCSSCTNSYFLYDCRGCTDCFMCSNLRNKSYCMYNTQFSKEEYIKRLQAMNLGDYSFVQEQKEKFENMKREAVHKYAHIINSYSVSGNNIENAKNCHFCYDITNAEDCKNLFWGGLKAKDVYDCGPGIGEAELLYEAFDGAVNGSMNLFTSVVYGSRNVEYSFNCYSCTNVFGCIGLRNKQYCILNTQYSKEEYEALILGIKKHMHDMPYVDQKGRIYRYGEFFPIELSPFCYNETVAQDYYPLTEDRAIEKGYPWKQSEGRNYNPTIDSENIADSIHKIEDSIIDEVIECAHKGECRERCSTAFRILKDELIFYKRFSIPLPRLCYGCRHASRLHKRNPMKLWHRECMCDMVNHDHNGTCSNEFDTTYSPDRTEKVFCEKCYQMEVI